MCCSRSCLPAEAVREKLKSLRPVLPASVPLATLQSFFLPSSPPPTNPTIMSDSVRQQHKTWFAPVLDDLLCATRCHGCGECGLISLRGYVGQYCTKACWYVELENDDWTCPFGESCYECDGGMPRTVSMTPSVHSIYRVLKGF